MYRFKPIPLPGFRLVESTPALGVEHHKQFLPGTTPSNQSTLNLYVDGEFELSIPAVGFTQRMVAGQTSLDVALSEYPAGVVCIERPLTSNARRLCLAPMEPSRWSRQVQTFLAGAPVPPPPWRAIALTGRFSLGAGPGTVLAEGDNAEVDSTAVVFSLV